MTRFPPYLNASAKATLPGSTEQVPREVQPGEQDRFIGAHHQQEAKDGSCRAEETGAEWWQKWPRLSVEIPIPIRLMSTLWVNCLLPMQKEPSDMRHFLLAGIGKRTVSPQSGHQPIHSTNNHNAKDAFRFNPLSLLLRDH